MDLDQSSGKPVSNVQRKLVSAGSERAAVRTFRLITAVFILLLSVPGLARAQNYTFTTIDVPGATATAANGNSTHEIVGEYVDKVGNTHGFVWNKGTPTTIDVPGAVATSLNGINAAGDVMGTYGKGGRNHAFAMIKGILTTLDPTPDDTNSQGGFINAQGEAVGTYRDGNPNPKPPDQFEKRRGFIWRKGVFTNTSINVPGDHPLFGTVALGTNDVGDVVGNYVDQNDPTSPFIPRHGFLRTSKGDYSTFNVRGAIITVAEGTNNSGTIVGAYVDAQGGLHGFVLSKRVLSKDVITTVDVTTVEVPGASGTQINSINAKGEIVGEYFDANDVQHGFLGTPVR
jgi:uncharacterized membrane protein